MLDGVTIFSLRQRDRWTAVHADGGLPSQSWDYAWGLSAAGVDAKLAVVRAAGALMLLPFVERDWMGTTDIATILGYSGASITPNSAAPLLLWQEYAAAQGWVAGYIQLAVETDLANQAAAGRVVTNNAVFLLDLTSAPDLNSFSSAIRRKIRQVEKSQTVLVEDDRAALIEALVRLYPDSMRRRGAAPQFLFPAETLERWATSPGAMMLGAKLGDAIEAVYLCLVAGAWAEFHLFASTEAGRGLAAWLIWQGLPRLRDRGAATLNLTGGMRPGDGLFRFKQGFHGRETPRRAVHQIYDPVKYGELCRLAGANSDDAWFPAYRAPRK